MVQPILNLIKVPKAFNDWTCLQKFGHQFNLKSIVLHLSIFELNNTQIYNDSFTHLPLHMYEYMAIRAVKGRVGDSLMVGVQTK